MIPAGASTRVAPSRSRTPGAGVVLPCLVVALATFLTGAFSAAPIAAQTNRPELLEVSFRGNQVVPSDTLQKIIQNRPSSCRSAIFLPVCWVSDALETKRFLYPRQVERDARRIYAFYYTLGYREAVVDTTLTRSPEGARLGFQIDEGRPIRIDSIAYRVFDDPPVPRLLQNLPVSVGDPFSSRRLEDVRDTIVGRLYEEGFAHAEVFRSSFIPADAPYEARVTFEIDPGPRVRFGAIRVSGNELLDSASILRTIPFREGQLYRPRLIEEAQRNIYSLDLIRNASVQPVTGPPNPFELDTIIPVQVQVAEGDLRRVRAGVGWSTADCFNTEARWTSRNFFGDARRLSISGRISNLLAPQLNETACRESGTDRFARLNGRFAIELAQPVFLSSRNSFAASTFVERESLRDTFVREAFGLSLGVTRALSRRSSATLLFTPQLVRLSAVEVYFCFSFLICTDEDIQVFGSANWLAPIGASFALDRSNSVLNPTDGWSAALDLEMADDWTGSDFAYQRLAGELAGYFGIGDFVLALRGRTGVVLGGTFDQLRGGDAELVHPQKRFYTGGSNTVRGYGENRLGPRVLTANLEDLLRVPEGADTAPCTPEQVASGSCDPTGIPRAALTPRPTGGSMLALANVELRFPIVGSTLQGVVFADAGQVWSEPGDATFPGVEVTPGLGVRYFSPIGPIRIDLGWRDRGTQALSVISLNGLRPYDPTSDDPGDRIQVRGPTGGTVTYDWVATRDLRRLEGLREFGAGSGFFNRLQLHLSIGQAF